MPGDFFIGMLGSDVVDDESDLCVGGGAGGVDLELDGRCGVFFGSFGSAVGGECLGGDGDVMVLENGCEEGVDEV